jgi:3',5'-cyclic AMP phosphodiesterase CpdA
VLDTTGARLTGMTGRLAQLAGTSSVRVVQLSDVHLAVADGVPPSVRRLLDWIAADPPDLVVATGDLVEIDPDLEADRVFARSVIGSLPCPWVAIPGNHDIGFFDEAERLGPRLAAFVGAWGDDRFALDAAGWRLVGLNAYRLGDDGIDEWIAPALDGSAPIAVFIHHPVDGEPSDGWEMPTAARNRFAQLVAGRPVRLVASGHRHCAVVRERPGGPAAGDAVHVWAPSTTLTGETPYHGGDPAPGAVEYRFAADGTFSHRFVSAATPAG